MYRFFNFLLGKVFLVMIKLRDFLYFFVILFVSSSVVVDWNGFSFDSNPRNFQMTMLMNEYEEHNLQISHLTAKHSKVKISKRRMWINDFFEKYSAHEVYPFFRIDNSYVPIRCAVKSFLHLLQLY